jgi:hypothetical protein
MAFTSSIVLMQSEDSNVTFGYKTQKQFFANMTRGPASSILKEAPAKGLAGSWQLFLRQESMGV